MKESINKNDLRNSLIEILPGVMETVFHAPNPRKLYSKKETARILGVSTQTIRRMIAQGRLIATTDGNSISQRAIDEYLMKRPQDTIRLKPGHIAVVFNNTEDYELTEQAITDAGSYSGLSCYDNAWNQSMKIKS